MRSHQEQKKLYDLLYEAYRKLGVVSYAGAAKIAGCNERTSKRVYENGYPEVPDCPPISQALAEAKTTRAAMAAEALQREEDARLAQREKAKSYMQEVEEVEDKILRGVRGDVLQMVAQSIELLPAMRAMGRVVASAVLDAQGQPLPLSAVKLSPKDAQGHIRTHIANMKRLGELATSLRQLGRTERGEANVIIQHKDEIPPEVAEQELNALHDFVQRRLHREKGDIITVGEEMYPDVPTAHVAALPEHEEGDVLDGDDEGDDDVEGEGGVRDDSNDEGGTPPPL